MSASRPKYLSLQAGRAVAAIMVVIYHAGHFIADPLRWNRPAIFGYCTGGALGVEAFFVLSGIVILSAHWWDIGRPSTVFSYLWKRFRRIYPIYWFALVVTLLSQIHTNDPQYAYQRRPLAVLSAVLLVNIRPESIIAVAWTLHHELMFYLVFSATLVRRTLGSALLGLWFAMSLFHLSAPINSLSMFSPLHLLFAMGMLGAWLLKRGTVPLPWALLGFGSVGLVSIIVAMGLGYALPGTPLLAGFASLLCFIGASRLELQGGIRIAGWVAFLGDASYSIYLIHFGVLSKLSGLFFRWNTHASLPILFWMCLMAVCGVAAGCLMHIAVERPLLHWLSQRRPVGVPGVGRA